MDRCDLYEGVGVVKRGGLKCSNLGDIVLLKRTIVRSTIDPAGAWLFVFPNLTHTQSSHNESLSVCCVVISG